MARIPPKVIKLRKQKRMRRKYLENKFSVVKVPRQISSAQYTPEAMSSAGFVNRMNSGTIRFLNSLMPDVPMKERKQLLENIQAMQHQQIEWALNNPSHSIRRRYALSRAEEEKLISAVEDPDVCDSYTVSEGGITRTRLTLVYNLKKTRCYFIEVALRDNGASYLMKSTTYGAEDRALFAFRNKSIDWLECLPLASLTLVLPRRGMTDD